MGKSKEDKVVLKYASNGKFYCPFLNLSERVCDYGKPCNHKPLTKQEVIGKNYEETINALRKICPYHLLKKGERNGEKLVDVLLKVNKMF